MVKEWEWEQVESEWSGRECREVDTTSQWSGECGDGADYRWEKTTYGRRLLRSDGGKD
jgi:hypothetical protein